MWTSVKVSMTAMCKNKLSSPKKMELMAMPSTVSLWHFVTLVIGLHQENRSQFKPHSKPQW